MTVSVTGPPAVNELGGSVIPGTWANAQLQKHFVLLVNVELCRHVRVNILFLLI